MFLSPVVVTLAGCGARMPPAVSGSSVALDPRGSDIAALREAVFEHHPAFGDGAPDATIRPRFEAALAGLERALPGLDDDGLLVGLLGAVAAISAEGRDGHTNCFPLSQAAAGFEAIPLALYLFPEGVFVTWAPPGAADLVGLRLTGITGDLAYAASS